MRKLDSIVLDSIVNLFANFAWSLFDFLQKKVILPHLSQTRLLTVDSSSLRMHLGAVHHTEASGRTLTSLLKNHLKGRSMVATNQGKFLVMLV